MDPVSHLLLKAVMMCPKSLNTIQYQHKLERLQEERKPARGSHRKEIDAEIRDVVKALKKSIKSDHGPSDDVDDLDELLDKLTDLS